MIKKTVYLCNLFSPLYTFYIKNLLEMKYKMIVLDLDGTLTNSKKEITPVTFTALMQAQKVGIKIVLASGRPTYGIMPLAKQLHLAQDGGYILAYNGGKMTDCTTDNVCFEQTLDKDFIPSLYRATVDYGMNILTYQGEGIAATDKNDKYVQHEAFINKMPVQQYDDFINQIVYPINKCLIVGNPTPLHQLELELVKAMEGKMEIYRSADYFLECMPLGIDKAKSLDRLCKMMAINREEIIACGDGYNDLSMIEYAGMGVAMANAPAKVKESANYITLSNEEDGVAHVVQQFILNQQ